MINRNLEPAIRRLLKKFPIVTLTGPRQSGKTTLLKNAFPSFRYVSLEDPDKRDFAQNDPRGFLKNYSGRCILDEVQRVPSLFSYLQTKVDADNKTGQYILSGSQNFMLLSSISQSLAGRVALLRLLPFSFAELKSNMLLPASLEQTIFTGFYPRLFDKKIAPPDFYPGYIETYVERDVRNLTNITDLDRFRTFIKLCAGRIGQIINFLSLANDAGISQPTAKAWLSVLESSYIIYRLPPYHGNFNKRIIKTPKLYFYDTGLACSLLGIHSASQIDNHFLKGGLFENLILNEIVKTHFNKGRQAELYFWRESNHNEIDILWQQHSRLDRIEIKYGNTFSTAYLKGINHFNAQAKVPAGKNWLVLGSHEYQRRTNLQITGWKELDKLTG